MGFAMSGDIMRKVGCLGPHMRQWSSVTQSPVTFLGGQLLVSSCQLLPVWAWYCLVFRFFLSCILMEISPIFKCCQLVEVQHTYKSPLPGQLWCMVVT